MAGETPTEQELMAQASEILARDAHEKILEFAMTGVFMNELHIDYEPPTVEARDGFLIFTQHLRFI